MNTLSKTILLASAMSCCLAMPAMADWYRIGSVDVSHGMDRDTSYSRFGGGVDKLRLDVRDSDVRCRSVRATFSNGSSHEIFQGRLRAGQPQDIDLPGERAHVTKLDFTCRASSRAGATIAISADVSTYRDEWRRNPDWNWFWAGVFNWDRPSGGNSDRHSGSGMGWSDNDWVSIGTQTFRHHNDRDAVVAGWRGRNVERIAVKPLNGDARCSRITARFRNGETRDLDVDRGVRMSQGRGYSFDLPGGDRNLREVTLQCSPLDRRSVRIEVLARK